MRSSRLVLLTVIGAMWSSFALAQTPATNPVPPAKSTARPAPLLSPEIAPDRQVTFRLRAPQAKSVTVTGQFLKSPAAMTKTPDGVWSVTVGPIAPDIYEYSFNVDGVQMIDPGNRAIKPMRAPRTSILEIPGTPPLAHDFQDVPHGTVRLHWYQSKSLGVRRPLQVYTPPNYDADASARFPVLYLFHGNGDNEATWVAHGHAHWILDNLIAQRRAVPMILVMLDGHAATAPGASSRDNVDAFERDLLQDVMPFVAKNYRTSDEPAHRGIIGLSMGGRQSLFIGLKHADKFAWVGGMSAAVMSADSEGDTLKFIGDGTKLKRQLKLLWFACGKDDRLLDGNKRLAAALSAQNVPHTYLVTDGGHTWPVWRKYLADFAPLVFQR